MNSRFFFRALLVLTPFLISAQVADSISRQPRSVVVIVEENDFVNASKKDHFITLGLFNGAGFINYRCYYSDRSAFRLGLSGRLLSTVTESNPPDGPKTSTNNTTRNVDLTFGLQTAFLKWDRLESYVALDLSPGYEASATETKTPVYAGGVYQYTTVRNTDQPYLNARLLPAIGANVYVYKGLSVGFEYRFSLLSYRQQLDYTEKVHTEDVNGNTIADPVSYQVTSDQKSRTMELGFNGNAFITVGLRLNK